MKKKIRMVLLAFFALTLSLSVWKLSGILSEYRAGTDVYDSLEQHASIKDEAPSADTSSESSADGGESPDISARPQVDFEQLSEINPDIAAWIYIEGTNVNYPIVQGSDNDYYLKRMFDGTYNSSGSIFLDYRCAGDFSDRHSIIYGHNMKNDSMFGDLVKYKDRSFYDEHPIAVLVTPSAYYKLQFFSGYVSDNGSSAWDLGLDTAEQELWIKEIKERSCFESDHAPTSEDRIVTLSTCTYEFDEAKFVLHGFIAEKILLSD